MFFLFIYRVAKELVFQTVENHLIFSDSAFGKARRLLHFFSYNIFQIW